MGFGLRPQTPGPEPGMRYSNYATRPFRPGVEIGMPDEAPDKGSYFVLADGCHNQAVVPMPEIRLIEAHVTSEESGIAQPAEEHDDLVVLQAFTAQIDSDLPCRYPPCLEQQALALKNVLVENNQARARSSTYSGAM